MTYHAFDVRQARVRNEKLFADIQSDNLKRQIVWNATTHAQCSFGWHGCYIYSANFVRWLAKKNEIMVKLSKHE